MINTKAALKRVLLVEREIYISGSINRRIRCYLRGSVNQYLWKYIKALRKKEYYRNTRTQNVFHNLGYYINSRRACKLGIKLGIEADAGVFDEGLKIYHPVGIVVNGDARVGKNCILHGSNIIGNMGENTGVPVIGDNVRLGIGAKVLGPVRIADNVQIGAGALVINSCDKEGALLVGVPAHIHERR